MMTIKVKDKIQGDAASRENGKCIYTIIDNNWDKEDKFELLFNSIKAITPSFMDEAFAKLVLIHDIKEIQNKLSFPDLNEYHKEKLNKAIELRLHQQTT